VWALGGIKKKVFLFSFPLKEKKRETLFIFSSLIIVIYQTFFENSDFAKS
jgi:uncharacterized membrane protein YobD (UPF0266 family)